MSTPVPSLPLAAYPVPAPAQPTPAIAPTAAQVAPPAAVPPRTVTPEPVLGPKVGLVLSDGAHLMLSMDDAAADAFRSLAQELSQGLT